MRNDNLYCIAVALHEDPSFLAQRRYLLLHKLEQATAVLVHSAESADSPAELLLAVVASGLSADRIEQLLNTSGVQQLQVRAVEAAYLKKIATAHGRYRAGLLGKVDRVTLTLDQREYERILLGAARLAAGTENPGIAADLLQLASRAGSHPLGDVLDSMEEAAVQAAREQGKRVRCRIQYGDLQVPSSVAGVLSEALLHLVRNAVDHGIELPADRTRVGKSETGELVLLAHENDGKIILSVEDDGRGIHLPGQEDALATITRPGFTTRAKSGRLDSSGRGVGLDIVRHSIERLLHGELRLIREPRTRFLLEIPSRPVLLSVVVVRRFPDNEAWAVPGWCVYERIQLHQSRFAAASSGGWYYHHNGAACEVDILGGAQQSDSSSLQEGLLIRTGLWTGILACGEAVAEEAVVLHPKQVYSEVLQRQLPLWDPWLHH